MLFFCNIIMFNAFVKKSVPPAKIISKTTDSQWGTRSWGHLLWNPTASKHFEAARQRGQSTTHNFSACAALPFARLCLLSSAGCGTACQQRRIWFLSSCWACWIPAVSSSWNNFSLFFCRFKSVSSDRFCLVFAISLEKIRQHIGPSKAPRLWAWDGWPESDGFRERKNQRSCLTNYRNRCEMKNEFSVSTWTNEVPEGKNELNSWPTVFPLFVSSFFHSANAAGMKVHSLADGKSRDIRNDVFQFHKFGKIVSSLFFCGFDFFQTWQSGQIGNIHFSKYQGSKQPFSKMIAKTQSN